MFNRSAENWINREILFFLWQNIFLSNWCTLSVYFSIMFSEHFLNDNPYFVDTWLHNKIQVLKNCNKYFLFLINDIIIFKWNKYLRLLYTCKFLSCILCPFEFKLQFYIHIDLLTDNSFSISAYSLWTQYTCFIVLCIM